MSNDKCPGKYQGNVTGAGVAGFFQGLTGLIGLGGFWQPIDQSKLQQAQKDMSDLKSKYDAVLAQTQDLLFKDQQQFMQDQSDYIQVLQAFHDELMSEQIQSNQLLIQIIAIIVIIIIIYLVVL